MAKITVQMLAEQLGVSKFAVSRALNNKPGVSDKTRALIIEAAERAGYRMRSGGRVLAIMRSEAEANRELWLDVRHGMEMQAVRENLDIDFLMSEDTAEIARMGQGAIAFLLIGPVRRAVMDAVIASGTRVVVVGHDVRPLAKVDQVTTTDAESGSAIGEFLLAEGHRKVLYLYGQAGFPGREARLQGLRVALRDEPDADIREMTLPDDYKGAGLLPGLRKLVDSGFEPTAIFCGSDGVAATALSEITRIGISVPQDCTIVGHGNYPLATQVSPTLTTIDMPNRKMGIEAIRLLANRLNGSTEIPQSPTRLGLVAEVVERESSGPARSTDWRALLSAGGY
ncbi:LacI family DNA-binding transcriptional regulator [Martelella mediterranea]|uniref:LacI family DNA-binding transcriptional regulator n=1 Tax=uncultured Martelella sp. TaxID=392331 RepID=UPI000D0593A1|nr:LacI family DNA-binding transcriptional regulator [uncultured Martelella sp.]